MDITIIRNEYARLVRDYAASRNGVTQAMVDIKYREIMIARKGK